MEVSNETHQKALNNICRLCHQKIKSNSKYMSAKGKYIYREEIQKLRKLERCKDHSVTVERCQIAIF